MNIRQAKRTRKGDLLRFDDDELTYEVVLVLRKKSSCSTFDCLVLWAYSCDEREGEIVTLYAEDLHDSTAIRGGK